MTYLFVSLVAIVLLFGFVVFYGAPYLPTLGQQTETALDLLDLKKGQTLLELGSGDGRVLIAAAERGIMAIGYEINPILVIISTLRTRKYGNNVRIVWGNFWHKQWPPTDGVFVFLLDKYMNKLDKLIIQKYTTKSVKLVSFAFKIPGKKPTKSKQGLYLYTYNN